MKTLLLVRHAKSSWENFSVPDEERPLNDRGKKNAPEMAKRVLKMKISIDAFLSSPAKRALSTAEYFAEAYELSRKDIQVIPGLYLAGPEEFLTAIREAPSEAATIAVFSHNDGITRFANLLSETRIDDMPTCAVFAVRCPISAWTEFETGTNQFYFFDYPKAGK